MSISRHPLLLTARSFFKLSVLPILYGMTGRKVGLPRHDIEGVHSQVAAESIEIDYPAVHLIGRAGCVSERKVDFGSASVLSILVDERASNIRLLSNGGLILQDKYLLGAGIHPSAGILASWWKLTLPECDAPNLVLPWAHPWGTVVYKGQANNS